MDQRLIADNQHIKDPNSFMESDPDLRHLKSQRFVHDFNLLEQLPVEAPGIYTLSGAHRAGKTTLLKSWMNKLLNLNIPPDAIVYFPSEAIEDYHSLNRALQKILTALPIDTTSYIIIDDINLVRDFQKAIIPLINEEKLNKTILLLSGADLTIKNVIQTTNSFHLYPLTFRETVLLKCTGEKNISLLYKEFNNYLIHGGHLEAINEIAEHGKILDKTLSNYGEWIYKQALARGKQENYLREILNSIYKHFNSQITWNLLAQELTIDHPKTIGDYFAFLENIDLIFIQYALLEESLSAAPKKARKLMFTDPFYFHAIQAWLSKSKNYFETQIASTLADPELCSKLVETCSITQYKRYYPTYYIKSEGEVDLAYVHNERFWPIETTWITQIRAKDLKQILKYQNGRILTKTERSGIIQHIRTEPLPLALWQLEDTNSNKKM